MSLPVLALAIDRPGRGTTCLRVVRSDEAIFSKDCFAPLAMTQMRKNSIMFFQETINNLDQKGLKRSLRLLDGAQKERVIFDGQEVLNFCSNNYLGLADHPLLKSAAISAIKQNGFGSGASRLVCGNMSVHEKLEEKLAKFKGAEASLIFNSGYAANVGIISSVFGRGDIIFSDKLNHASIIDGIILSQAEMKRYPHCDMDALEEMLKKSSGYKKRGIITDSVFSMDGDLAPLDKIVALAKTYDCLVMIDEAHSFGVMGKNGKGLAEHFGVENEIDIQMGTFSKAAGSFGAYVCGSKDLIAFLMNKARSFIYTTSLPPSVCAASLAGVEIIEKDPQLRIKLLENTNYLRSGIKQLGFDTLNSQTPIIPILVKDSEVCIEFSKRLFNEGILITAIRPPTVPANTARLRLTVMATHVRRDLDACLEKLKKIGKNLAII